MGLNAQETKKVISQLEPVSFDAVVFERLRETTDREITYRDGSGWEQTIKVFDPHRQKVKRSPKGRQGITRYGSKMVRNACHVLQTHYGRGRLGFGTLTLDSANPNYLLLSASLIKNCKGNWNG
jgi:hypothetical protein